MTSSPWYKRRLRHIDAPVKTHVFRSERPCGNTVELVLIDQNDANRRLQIIMSPKEARQLAQELADAGI